jgi:hypothetical protein
VEEFNKVNIVGRSLEVFLQQNVDSGFKDEGIVDGNASNIWHQVPARRATTSLGAIHDIVGDQEHSLELYKTTKYNKQLQSNNERRN